MPELRRRLLISMCMLRFGAVNCGSVLEQWRV